MSFLSMLVNNLISKDLKTKNEVYISYNSIDVNYLSQSMIDILFTMDSIKDSHQWLDVKTIFSEYKKLKTKGEYEISSLTKGLQELRSFGLVKTVKTDNVNLWALTSGVCVSIIEQ